MPFVFDRPAENVSTRPPHPTASAPSCDTANTLTCGNVVELRDSNPLYFLQKPTLICGNYSMALLRDVSVSCGYASACYAT